MMPQQRLGADWGYWKNTRIKAHYPGGIFAPTLTNLGGLLVSSPGNGLIFSSTVSQSCTYQIPNRLNPSLHAFPNARIPGITYNFALNLSGKDWRKAPN
jgi:hypothetical protein